MYIPKKAPELDTSGNLVGKFKTLLENVQEFIIIKKLHGGTKMWCIQLKTIIIDTTQLNKV
jgi:hypothetical protein